MNTYARNARAAYVKNDLENLSREEIVVKLYQGLRMRMQAAIEEIRDGKVGKKAEHLSRALAIVLELQSSLDLEQGGEIAANLQSLYGYLVNDLVAANRHNDIDKIEDGLRVVEPLLEAWSELARQQQAQRPARRPGIDQVTFGSESPRVALSRGI